MKHELKVLSLLHILNDGFRITVTTTLPFIAKDLSLSLTQIGILGSSQTFIGILFAIPSAYFAAKIGGFKLLIVSLLLYAVGFLGIGFSPNFFLLLLSIYIGAVGFAFFHPVSFALVTRLSAKGMRGKNMGTFISLGDIGRLLISALALLVIPWIGWRPVMIILSMVALNIYFFTQLFTFKEVPIVDNISPFGQEKRVWFKKFLVLLADHNFIRVLLTAMGDSLASSNIYTFLPFLLLARGITPAQLVIFTTVYFFGSLSGKFFSGRAVDTFGNKRVFIISEISMALVLLLLGITVSFPALVMISYLLGGFTKGTSPVVQTMISEVIHEEHFEKAFGVSETFIQIAAAMTIFISGLLADHFGITVVFYVSAVLAVLATVPILTFKTSKIVIPVSK